MSSKMIDGDDGTAALETEAAVFRREFEAISKLGIPFFVANMLEASLLWVTVMSVGRLGVAELGAAALAMNTLNLYVLPACRVWR